MLGPFSRLEIAVNRGSCISCKVGIRVKRGPDWNRGNHLKYRNMQEKEMKSASSSVPSSSGTRGDCNLLEALSPILGGQFNLNATSLAWITIMYLCRILIRLTV